MAQTDRPCVTPKMVTAGIAAWDKNAVSLPVDKLVAEIYRSMVESELAPGGAFDRS